MCDKSIKYAKCDILENKIEHLYNILDKFTKEGDKLNIILDNQIRSYNKVGLGYQSEK